MTTHIENEHLSAVFDTDFGASILTLEAKRKGEHITIMPDARDPKISLPASNFLMVPYSNRIKDGKFSWQGQDYQLRDPEVHSRHGDVRKRAWEVVEHSADKLVCHFSSSTYADINWPWPFTADVVYYLDGSALVSELTITNVSETAFPVGTGWHPFFCRSLCHKDEPVFIQMKTEKVFPDANDDRVPSGPSEAIPTLGDFSEPRQLDPNYFIDDCRTGYDGKGSIYWPQSGIRVTFECSDNLTQLVMFNPADEPFFAVEPVTNASNGINKYNAGDNDSGIDILNSGETYKAAFTMRVDIESK